MFACPLIWFTLNLIFQIVQLSSAKAALEDSTREVTCKMRVFCPPIEIMYFSLTCGGPQLLEEQLQSVLQQQAHLLQSVRQEQAHVAAEQASTLGQTLDAKSKELSEVRASLADLNRHHGELQAKYDARCR